MASPAILLLGLSHVTMEGHVTMSGIEQNLNINKLNLSQKLASLLETAYTGIPCLSIVKMFNQSSENKKFTLSRC